MMLDIRFEKKPTAYICSCFVCKKYSPKTIGINLGTGVIYNVLKFNAGNFYPFLCLIIKI